MRTLAAETARRLIRANGGWGGGWGRRGGGGGVENSVVQYALPKEKNVRERPASAEEQLLRKKDSAQRRPSEGNGLKVIHSWDTNKFVDKRGRSSS